MAKNVKSSKVATESTTPKFVSCEHIFNGIVVGYTPLEEGGRLIRFSCLNREKTATVSFYASLADDKFYLAPYIKSGKCCRVTVRDLPPVNEKRRFAVVSIMSYDELARFNELLKYEPKEVK